MKNSMKLKFASISFFITLIMSYNAFAQERVATGFDKGFFVSSADNNYALRINGRLQTRAQYDYLEKKHAVGISIPNARMMFSGHVFEPRYGYATQFAYDNGDFKLIDFFANIGLTHEVGNLKIGRFLGSFSLLDANSNQKLEFTDRSKLLARWKIDAVNGISLSNDKMNTISWDIGIYENGIARTPGKRRGAVSASIAYNHNQLDATNEPDFDGGALRYIVLLGAFSRAQIDDWKLIGYAATLGGMAKYNHFSFNAGFFLGAPEAPLSAGPIGTNGEQKLSGDHFGLGTFGQAGYLFSKRYGVAARYALAADQIKGPVIHEILASTSAYLLGHNLKLQAEAGTYVKASSLYPLVRAQFQLAF